ncbi:MAG: metallophosphoesterase [Helicobacteraceae bacterium]|nr:metallophosphoesterase [Helicobacteraceae bacterium]
MNFFIIALCVFILFHIVGYYGLIRHISQKPKVKFLSGILTLLNCLLVVCFVAILIVLRVDFPRFVILILSLFILSAVLFFGFGVINAILLLIFRKSKEKRILISRIMLIITSICFVFSIFNAAIMPQLTTQEILIPNLKQEMTILMISDLHLSKFISKEKVSKIIDLANSTNPDIIVLVGDIIDAKESEIREFLPYLEKLRAKNGVYFTLGNHEFIFNVDKSLELIQSLPNVEILLNSSVVIDDNINLIGISDLSGRRRGYLEPDIDLAMSKINKNLPSIVLSHQPNMIYEMPNNIDLMLSGHTHGGQIFPFSIAVYFANPFLYGLKSIDNKRLYISQGASLAVTFGRLGSRAEINLITLKMI